MVELIPCNRCKRLIDKEAAEFCWYCHAYLCIECWREVGHCGHLAADQANEEASRRGKEAKNTKCLEFQKSIDLIEVFDKGIKLP